MKHCIVAVLVVSTTATAEALPNRSGRGVKEFGHHDRDRNSDRDHNRVHDYDDNVTSDPD